MENEDYYEESSDQEVEVGQQAVVVDVVAPQPTNIPLEVHVVPLDNPVSPSLSRLSSPEPSLAASPAASPGASPPASPPVGGVTSFMGFYTHDDLVGLEQWSVDSRAAWADPTSRIGEPNISPNLKIFLRYTLGAQWEVKIIRESGEVLIEQLRAYLAGHNQLTSFNRWQWLQMFPAWTVLERREQLELLANAGGFVVVYCPRALLRVVGRSRPASLFYVLYSAVVVKILELHKKEER